MLDPDRVNDIVPELSDNLHFNKLSENEYILSNVNHKHYLKINRQVYNLLFLIDGKKTLPEIMREYNAVNKSALSLNKIYDVLYNKLSSYGVLQGFDDKIKGYQKPSYLSLSFIIINERIVSKIVKHLYFFFNKKVAFSLLISCSLLISFLLYFNIDLYKSFNLNQSLVYFFLVMAVSVTFHEIGHATSASYFGAKHGGIGGGFYLITPVYFADVTDIWRLSKLKRIVVNLSGMYFELIFCSILSIVALALNNYILLTVSIIVCVRTLFNLNPFLRSDGYWVLSDLTNKPNLLHHSGEKAKDIFRWVFKRKKLEWKVVDFMLMIYGLISYSFVLMLLYYVLIKNPNSVIYFPNNFYNFFKAIFQHDTEFSLVKYAELLVPIVFFILLYKLVKPLLIKLKNVFREKKMRQ